MLNALKNTTALRRGLYSFAVAAALVASPFAVSAQGLDSGANVTTNVGAEAAATDLGGVANDSIDRGVGSVGGKVSSQTDAAVKTGVGINAESRQFKNPETRDYDATDHGEDSGFNGRADVEIDSSGSDTTLDDETGGTFGTEGNGIKTRLDSGLDKDGTVSPGLNMGVETGTTRSVQ